MPALTNKTLFISGASRGIGRAIALRAARDGANIVIAAKSAEPHPKLPGTIHEVAREVEALGGRALALQVDIRSEDQVQAAVEKAVATFGGIDILVNNASAINLTSVLDTQMKRYDLMMDINVRGTFVCSQCCIPWLKRAANPHILTLSPPLNIQAKWFAQHAAYTTSKFSMSLLTLGLSEELKSAGVAANSLWPRTFIATAALTVVGGGLEQRARVPEIVADAAYEILSTDSRKLTGQFLLDEDVLRAAGRTDFSAYAAVPGVTPHIDLFVEP